MLTIREATISDAEMIAKISRETFYETFAEHNTPADMEKFLSQQFSEQLLISQVSISGNSYLLAYENENLAGYAFLSDDPSASAIEICRLYARSNYIGKGIGKALMQAAIDFARAKNKEYIWLGVWEHNRRAIDFYTSFGYEKFGEHEFVLGDDVQIDWLMKMQLI